jgi:ribonuclease D
MIRMFTWWSNDPGRLGRVWREADVEATDYGRRNDLPQEAIAYLAQIVPQAKHDMRQVQATAHCVTEAAENGGPRLFARIGTMQAIHRHRSVISEPLCKGARAYKIVR